MPATYTLTGSGLVTSDMPLRMHNEKSASRAGTHLLGDKNYNSLYIFLLYVCFFLEASFPCYGVDTDRRYFQALRP